MSHETLNIHMSTVRNCVCSTVYSFVHNNSIEEDIMFFNYNLIRFLFNFPS